MAGRGESGQAMIEMGIYMTVFCIITIGLVDVGRAFYQYNALANAARYASRWGSVVGGNCSSFEQESSIQGANDWCYQLQSQLNAPFWQQAGNMPLQPGGTYCPSTYGAAGFPIADYYSASDYITSNTSTIVGAVAERFDTNSGSSSMITGPATPGFDLSQLKVCIQLPYNSASTSSFPYVVSPGSRVTVYLYYPFTPVTTLLGHGTINLTASSSYEIE